MFSVHMEAELRRMSIIDSDEIELPTSGLSDDESKVIAEFDDLYLPTPQIRNAQ